MMDNHKNKKYTWERIIEDYCKLIIPNRPSLGDCENYGKLIARYLPSTKGVKIMLMGATPELRRILYTYGYLQQAEVSCLDITPGMYKAMTKFLSRGRYYKEKYFKRSWLDTKFPNQYFDLIVGDEVICNVGAKSHRKLFQEISRILKDQGIWITRHNVYLPETKEIDASKIILDLARKIDRGEYSFQRAMNLLFIRTYFWVSAAGKFKNTVKSHMQIFNKEYQRTLKHHKYSKIIKELLNFYQDNFVAMCGDYQWSVISKKEGEKGLKEFFEIEKTVYSHDYPTAKNGPIYVLKKKYGSKR